MRHSLIAIAVVLFMSGNAWGYSAGAPETVCDDMTPRHPVDPQKTQIPYKVTPSKTKVEAGQEIDLTISGSKTFKGFLVQVREGDKAVGSFPIADTDRYIKPINCHGTKGSAATHKNATEKNNLVLKWRAPSKPGKYTIFATVAEDGGTFWARHPVGTIQVV